MSLSVKQIKSILEAAGVDYSDCSEKSELIARLTELRSGKAKVRRQQTSGGATTGTSQGYTSATATPPRPKASSTPAVALGRRQDGSDGGPVGELIREVCGSTCYYAILGAARDADAAALKKLYRKRALKLHPDKCNLTGAEEAFSETAPCLAQHNLYTAVELGCVLRCFCQRLGSAVLPHLLTPATIDDHRRACAEKVSSAFACLSDRHKRSAYDTWGTETPGGAGFGGGGFGSGGGANSCITIVDDRIGCI